MNITTEKKDLTLDGKASFMPGCCGIMVLNDLQLVSSSRHFDCAELACNTYKVNTLLATTNETMPLIVKKLQETGWEKIPLNEVNPRTGNRLTLWIYNKKIPIEYEEEEDYYEEEVDEED